MKSDIRMANEHDIPDLCAVWQSCFPDPGEYIRLFYRENFGRIGVLVYTVDGKPVSMVNLMDAAFAEGLREDPVKYVYAVGTLPEYRDKGLMRSLLLSAAHTAEEKGYGLFLKPVPALIEYYSYLGFTEDSHFKLFEAAPGKNREENIYFSPISAEEYNRLRNRAFNGRPYVKWSDSHLRWCVKENGFCGGKTVAFTLDGGTRFLMACPSEGVLRIIETDLNPEQLRRISSALCGLFSVSRILAYLPEDASCKGSSDVSSLVFNAPLRRTYANLLLI